MKSNLKKTIKKELSALNESQILLTEQTSGTPQTDWDQVWCGTPPLGTTWPPCGTYTHLNYRIDMTGCLCDNYDASTGTCSTPPITWNNVQPGGVSNPEVFAVGDTFTGTQNNPNALPYVVMSITPWGCNPNDPGINSNPSNCPQGFGYMTSLWLSSTSCYSTSGYHMWTECSDFTGTGGSESMTWSGLPGYVSGADLSNSQIFYDWIDTTIGGISVGDVIKIDLTATQTYTLCLQYDGVTTNVTPVTPWNSPLSIVSSHPDCDDCVNGSTENFACMGGIIPGPGTCMGPGNYSMGQTYVQAVYPTMADCQADPKCGSTQDERGCLDINALNYNVCCDNDPNCIVTIPDPECCRYEHEPDHRGCMDSTAINYMDCCDLNIPGCTPTLSDPTCCKYEGGSEDKGCMDPSATNYNICCNGDPNCTVVGSNQECCRYEGDPNPCDTNPKECWFCEPGDINTSGWVDPMALTNSNGGCIQFLSTSATFASGYSGQMYTTQSDCTTNSDCGPTTRGELEYCQCCNGGNAQSQMQQVPIGSCSSLNGGPDNLTNCQPQQSQPISCNKPLPTNATPLAEEIKRYKELL